MKVSKYNPQKSEIFIAGHTPSDIREVIEVSGLSQGFLPTRYLGLPLNSVKLSFSGLQPFIEKITAKIHSWTAKSLSYAGKIRLVAAVIYGMVNFWSQVFVLPKRFYKKVDSLCSNFLWKNSAMGSRGRARVSWEDLCRPREEGGVGLRKLEDFQDVFKLKRVWELFDKSESLWIAWVKIHVLKKKSYWLTKPAPRFSWNINQMLAMRDRLGRFLHCKIHDGRSASFWYDHWTPFGPLIDFISNSGPRQLRLRLDATVSSATSNNGWDLPPARSNAVQLLQEHLINTAIPSSSTLPDQFLWLDGAGNYKPKFNTKETWKLIRDPSPLVSWSKAVWFSIAIPRCSFIHWLVMLGRLPTRDRLHSWGIISDTSCLLCANELETHHHLFFACDFVQVIWRSFMVGVATSCPSNILSASSWLSSNTHNLSPNHLCLSKLLQQVILYFIWKERNSRLFNRTAMNQRQLKQLIDNTIRSRLKTIEVKQGANRDQQSLLSSYFAAMS